MKYELEIYVEGQRLDTFDFESINLKKSTKDFKDISKVFTSFSRSITVPASKTNNRVFKYYQNVNIVQGGFDARSLKDAELKINGNSLEKGKIALESVKKRLGTAQSYTVRFYGGLTELKKRLGEDYIHNLDTSADNIDDPDYKSLLSDDLSANPNVAFILSSLNRRFIYAQNNYNYVSDNNLSGQNIVNIARDFTGGFFTVSDEYGVVDSDLVGTYRVGAIIDAIESKYNLSFTGAVDFEYISNYRILLNSSDRDVNISTMNEYIDYTLSSNTHQFPKNTLQGQSSPSGYFPTLFNASGNKITTTDEFESRFLPELSNYDKTRGVQTKHQLRVCVTTTLNTFEVDVLRNGEVVGTISESQSQETASGGWYGDFDFNSGTDTRFSTDQYEGAADWTFKARAVGNGSLTISYRFGKQRSQQASGVSPEFTSYDSFTISTTTSGESFFNVSANLPKLKIKDFISILTKQFNLIPDVTINESGTHTVDFKHYDYYINQGNSYDITEYVDIDNETVKPANFYSGIEFNYKEPESAMQQAFFKVNNREYGSLNYEVSQNSERITGNSFEMNLDTHRLPIERLVDLTSGISTINWLQLTDLNNEKIDLGAVFLYATNDSTTINYNTGLGNQTVASIVTPSNMYYTNQESDSQELAVSGNFFGSESDEYFANSKTSSLGLVNLYWDSYLSLMFDARTRKVKLSAFLPEQTMLNLKTNDKLSINDRKFLIESFETNFGTGKTSFELIEVTSELLNLFELNENDFSSELSALATNEFKHVGLSSSGEMSNITGSQVDVIGNVKNRFVTID